ncbi:hypothetical protein [Candidatus Laterigemmans baculatus]|uniref:hypothetical protein n=1 Tax=Candidatus Laterigemmans baculatus TaxID=2770505 RepID=UPI0013DA72FF|nr:hypothetical protein [Candidatus Laterigemmans baculatus]
MFQTALRAVAIVGVAAGVAAVSYCVKNDIRSADDWRNFRAMRSESAPIMVALANGSLTAGDSVREMLAVERPVRSDDYGRCVIYRFAPERSYDYRTVVTVDGFVVAAHAGSCTWRWTFFDHTPSDIAASVSSVNGLRSTMDQMPTFKHLLQPMLDAELAKLAVQPAAP